MRQQRDKKFQASGSERESEAMNSVSRTAIFTAVGLSLSIASIQAQTVGIQDVSDWSNAEVVDLDLTAPALGASYNGGVYAGVNTFQLTLGNTSFDVNGFCIDPYHWSTTAPYTDTIVPLSDAPKSPGPMSAAASLDVEELWAMYYTPSLTSSSVAGGLQLAIWEEVTGSINGGEYFSLDAGQSGPGQIGYVAQQDIASLATFDGPLPNLVALTSADGQDYVVQSFVPDHGTTFGLMVLALAGLAAAPRLMPNLAPIRRSPVR